MLRSDLCNPKDKVSWLRISDHLDCTAFLDASNDLTIGLVLGKLAAILLKMALFLAVETLLILILVLSASLALLLGFAFLAALGITFGTFLVPTIFATMARLATDIAWKTFTCSFAIDATNLHGSNTTAIKGVDLGSLKRRLHGYTELRIILEARHRCNLHSLGQMRWSVLANGCDSH